MLFFFKQKTAYEMRISDWSSDVCSSDLSGMVYVRFNNDGTLKSSVDKFYNENDLRAWAQAFGAREGDLMLILAGPAAKTRKALSELRQIGRASCRERVCQYV